jgi:PAS domain-containing protein
LVLRLQTGNFAFLAAPSLMERYLLVWLCGLAVVLVAWELARRSAQADALEAALDQQQAALAQKTEVLQRTATDLGDRVLELRSLQEVAKALATTLRTEETLRVIVERLRGSTGSSRCAVALADMDAGALDGVLASETATRPFRLALGREAPTLSALRGERVVRVGHDEPVETPLHRLLDAAEYTITPLVSRGLPIGALYLAEVPAASADDDAAMDAPGQSRAEQLLASFAYFAATAVENAQLYQDAWEKRRELEAVLAGIGDGVVVVDPDLHLILMNPVARHVLEVDEDPPVGVPLRPYLPAPAFADLLSDTLQSRREQIRELCLGSDDAGDAQRTFRALASPVVNADGQVSGVVAVLRDITAE